MTLRREQEDLMKAKGYMTVARAAKCCGVTRQTVNLWMQKSVVRSIRVGFRVYVERASLLEHLGPEGAKMLDGK